MEILIINDGDVVDNQIVNDFGISELCSKGKSAFVGFVNQKGRILLSCPKHFVYKGEEDINLILRTLIKSSSDKIKGSSDVIDCNIPFIPYLNVVDYYHKYGLHKKYSNQHKPGYSGNVDWRKTIKTCPQVMNDDGIVYIPLSIKKKVANDTFLSECMKYVLNDGYEQFGKYVGIGEKIDIDNSHYSFKNSITVIRQLKLEESNVFRDSEIQLIRSLIAYFSWEGSITDRSYFISKSYDSVWEKMVNYYLSNNYYDYDKSSRDINFVRNCKKHYFRKVTSNVESADKHPVNRGFYVEFDHLVKNYDNDFLLLFDSKYYMEISELNYKQMSYHYLLANGSDGIKIPTNKIINGLILPTEKEYFSKVHVDRTDIDGVYIREHYLNIRTVMDFYA